METLSESPFNKVRMCIFPKWYELVHKEPELFPYKDTALKKWDFWWINPKNGNVAQIKRIPHSSNHIFDPPGNPGGDNDWILVIDNASKGYTEPGNVLKIQK